MLVIDPYHSMAKLSLKSFVFTQQSSARPDVSVRLVQKQSVLFSLDSMAAVIKVEFFLKKIVTYFAVNKNYIAFLMVFESDLN